MLPSLLSLSESELIINAAARALQAEQLLGMLHGEVTTESALGDATTKRVQVPGTSC